MSRSQDQDDRDARNRRKTLVRLLTFAQANRIDAVELMDQVDQLGLTLELAELALKPGGDPKRHRRIAAARAAAELPELEEAVADLTVGLGEIGDV